MDATRLPEGIIINSVLTTARPVGTIVRDPVTGGLFISTNALVATFSPVDNNVYNPVASSTTVGNDTPETAYSNGTYSIAANSLRAGSIIRIRTGVSVIGAAGGAETMVLRCRIGGLAGSLLIASPTTTTQLDFLNLDIQIVVRTVGTAGTFVANALGGGGLTGVGGNGFQGGLLQTAINTTIAQDVVVSYDWSAAAADATSALYFLTVDYN